MGARWGRGTRGGGTLGRRRPRDRRGLVTATTAMAVATALVGSACADGADDRAGGDQVVTGDVDFEATGRFLAAASERSAGEPHRVEASISLHVAGGGDELSIDEVPIVTGVQDGDRYSYQLDMQEFMDQFTSEAGGPRPAIAAEDYMIEAAGDAETMYIRAPLYAALVEQAPPGRDTGAYGELASLGDSWGRVDRRALDDLSVAQLQQLTGAPTSASGDPQVLLDLVAGADDVEELGTDEIAGTGVNGSSAELGMGEMMEAGGTDPDDFVDQMAANETGPGDAEARAALAERMLDAEVPVEVWVDGEGYVRRISVETDFVDILGTAFLLVSDEDIDEFRVGSTTDYSGYGDEAIAIELPTDAVDATDIFRRALEAGPPGG